MGVMLFIVAAVFKTHPPNTADPGYISSASHAMAALIYLYCIVYSFGWGPVPWVYVADIFPNRTRHYGLATAAGTSWLFNFAVSKITPFMVTALGYKLFITFGTINLLGTATFAWFIPETAGKSLEEMDILFGAITKTQRAVDIEKPKRVVDEEAGLEPIKYGDDKVERQSMEKDGHLKHEEGKQTIHV